MLQHGVALILIMGNVLSGQTGTVGEYILSLRGGGISKTDSETHDGKDRGFAKG